MKRIVLSANTSWYIWNFRRVLVERGHREGHSMWVVAPQDGYSAKLVEAGCQFQNIDIDNQGTNPLKDLRTVAAYLGLYRRLVPDAVLHFTIKPVIYGSVAARLLGIPVVNTIPGLGTVFSKGGFVQELVKGLYRASQRKVHRVFFQNGEDRDLFVRNGLVAPEQAVRVPGSGVNLNRFRPGPFVGPGEKFVFLLLGRLIWDKGVGEYVAAARIMKSRHADVLFQIMGFTDVENPGAVRRDQVEQWVRQGVIEFLGASDEVEKSMRSADCVVLPTYYGEGIPRSLLEAHAMGKPVIASDHVGCREVVQDGVSGLLCKPKDVDDLVLKMEAMRSMDPDLRRKMGEAARIKAVEAFDEDKVANQYFSCIQAMFDR